MLLSKRLLPLLLLFLSFGLFLPSCYYDKADALYPFQRCDTTHVTYSSTIVPIFSTNCLNCHNTGDPQGNVNLDSWAGTNAQVTNGKLIPAVDHTGPYPMPKGSSMLDVCSIEKIKRWVANGAPNN